MIGDGRVHDGDAATREGTAVPRGSTPAPRASTQPSVRQVLQGRRGNEVKDLNPTLNNWIEIVGRGNIDFPSIFAAAGGSTRYFVVENDPRFGDPTFNPFEAEQEGFAYLSCTSY